MSNSQNRPTGPSTPVTSPSELDDAALNLVLSNICQNIRISLRGHEQQIANKHMEDVTFLKTQTKDLRKKLNDTEQQRKEDRASLDAEKKNTEEMQAKLDAAEKLDKVKQAKLDAFDKDREVTKAKLKDTQAKLDASEKDREEAEDKLREIQTKLLASENEGKDTQAKLDAAERLIKEKQTQLVASKKETKEIQAELDATEAMVEQMKAETEATTQLNTKLQKTHDLIGNLYRNPLDKIEKLQAVFKQQACEWSDDSDDSGTIEVQCENSNQTESLTSPTARNTKGTSSSPGSGPNETPTKRPFAQMQQSSGFSNWTQDITELNNLILNILVKVERLWNKECLRDHDSCFPHIKKMATTFRTIRHARSKTNTYYDKCPKCTDDDPDGKRKKAILDCFNVCELSLAHDSAEAVRSRERPRKQLKVLSNREHRRMTESNSI